MKVHTSVIARHRQSCDNSFDGNTHLIGEAWPPDHNKHPDLVKNWDVSVLGTRDGQYVIV